MIISRALCAGQIDYLIRDVIAPPRRPLLAGYVVENEGRLKVRVNGDLLLRQPAWFREMYSQSHKREAVGGDRLAQQCRDHRLIVIGQLRCHAGIMQGKGAEREAAERWAE